MLKKYVYQLPNLDYDYQDVKKVKNISLNM